MKPRPPSIVVIAIMTTVTVVAWVFFNVYRALTTEPDPSVAPELLQQLDPTLDVDLLAQTEQRVYFEKGTTQAFGGVPVVIQEVPEEQEEIVEESSLLEELAQPPESTGSAEFSESASPSGEANNL